MPWLIEGNCVYKKNEDGSKGEKVKCHESEEKAKAHMRALYANVKDSEIAEFSLTVVKASYDKSEKDPDRKRRILMVSSDTSPDLYEERMSADLFKDFISHIENNDPIPEAFKSVVCEDSWCGGMPYISLAHYRAGKDGKNVPGTIECVYMDGNKLKSKAFLHDTPLGRKLFDSLCEDLEKFKSGTEDHKPIRVSIGFLDLEHQHVVEGKSVTFTRTELGQKCPLCEKGMGGKIYKKGYLVHEAATRVPVNQRTEMALEEKSMDDIITKHDDAASIVGEELASELEQKSLADDVLVVKSDGDEPEWKTALKEEIATVKSELMDVVAKSMEKLQASPVVEESMETEVIAEKAMDKEHEEKMEDEKEEKQEEKSVPATPSVLDAKFESLKSLIAEGKSLEEVQNAFNALGKEVEKSIPQPAPTATDIAAIVKSAVEEAVKPLAVKIAQLEAGNTGQVTRSMEHPVSRALSLKPSELMQKSQPSNEQLTQIQRLARGSVYGQ